MNWRAIYNQALSQAEKLFIRTVVSQVMARLVLGAFAGPVSWLVAWGAAIFWRKYGQHIFHYGKRKMIRAMVRRKTTEQLRRMRDAKTEAEWDAAVSDLFK